jgi:hypothetical protein
MRAMTHPLRLRHALSALLRGIPCASAQPLAAFLFTASTTLELCLQNVQIERWP